MDPSMDYMPSNILFTPLAVVATYFKGRAVLGEQKIFERRFR